MKHLFVYVKSRVFSCIENWEIQVSERFPVKWNHNEFYQTLPLLLCEARVFHFNVFALESASVLSKKAIFIAGQLIIE